MKKVRKCVIPAAGLGTRFLPATKGVAKEMFPIVDKPTLLYQVEEAVAAGIEEVIIIISKAKEDIKRFFERDVMYENYLISKKHPDFAVEIKKISTLAKITYVYQNEQRGLGHAILCAKEAIGDEPFLVILGDDLIINYDGDNASTQLINAFNETGASILGVQKVRLEDTYKFGIIDPQSEKGRLIQVRGMVEKPKDNPPSLYAAQGRYVISSEIFPLLETTAPGAGGEIQLTDALRRLEKLYAYNFEGSRYDIGDKFGYVKAIIDFSLRRDDLKDKVKQYIDEIK